MEDGLPHKLRRRREQDKGFQSVASLQMPLITKQSVSQENQLLANRTSLLKMLYGTLILLTTMASVRV